MLKVKMYLHITKIYLMMAYNYITMPLAMLLGFILGLAFMTSVRFSDYKDLDGKFNVINFAIDGKDWIIKRMHLYSSHFNFIVFIIILAIILYK